MEWTTVQHLDLRHIGRSLKPLQPHAAAFHANFPLIAATVKIGARGPPNESAPHRSISCYKHWPRISLKELTLKITLTICAQYKIAVALFQEIGWLQKVQGHSTSSTKDEMVNCPAICFSSSSRAPNVLHQGCHKTEHEGVELCLCQVDACSSPVQCTHK
ncbi:hypothetical protein HHK36_030895 [Tetracentron sinense]|uniref:Uncharacterized protein n=1 Tax=Tetracentron sinense TaxID=13715 RepID=A0A834Y8F1_TETSI|nr:hypothetical protein HHK36_030895 [Tetracentron sinense]